MSLAEEKPIVNQASSPYRVMVVDDSAVIRGLLSRILESDPSVDVVASASNGEQAVKILPKSDVEVVVLDIEMPVMDGLTALPKLLAINPRLKIIMASTLTQRNAQISFKALSAGATDYIPKPVASSDINNGEIFKRDLCDKVKVLGQAYRGDKKPHISTSAGRGLAQPDRAQPDRAVAPSAKKVFAAANRSPITLRKNVGKQADIIAIGSSTGGPQALLTLLKNFESSINLPIIITQHMPPTFTGILAEHIARASGRPCAEGVDGEVVMPGKIYIAPGDWHMVVKSSGSSKVIHLHQEPPVNFCRPAVDPLFESLAEAYDGRILAVILTGMGQDGLNGGKTIIDRGGVVIAQDEASSVVWGMPGAVAMAGICNAVLPLESLAGYIHNYPKRAVQ